MRECRVSTHECGLHMHILQTIGIYIDTDSHTQLTYPPAFKALQQHCKHCFHALVVRHPEGADRCTFRVCECVTRGEGRLCK